MYVFLLFNDMLFVAIEYKLIELLAMKFEKLIFRQHKFDLRPARQRSAHIAKAVKDTILHLTTHVVFTRLDPYFF